MTDDEKAKLLKLYEEICKNIQITDDISFKLLGFVPVVSTSGATILGLVKIWDQVSSILVVFISITAMVVTFGLYKWEMRNTQRCKWIIGRAADIERVLFNPSDCSHENHSIGQFVGWGEQLAPPLLGKEPELVAPLLPEAECKGCQQELRIRKSTSRSFNIRSVGKTEAERILYWGAILAWIAPIVVAFIKWKFV